MEQTTVKKQIPDYELKFMGTAGNYYLFDKNANEGFGAYLEVNDALRIINAARILKCPDAYESAGGYYERTSKEDSDCASCGGTVGEHIEIDKFYVETQANALKLADEQALAAQEYTKDLEDTVREFIKSLHMRFPALKRPEPREFEDMVTEHGDSIIRDDSTLNQT